MVDWRRRRVGVMLGRRIGIMLRRRIWKMSLIGLMRNGFGIPKFWSVGAFWMVEHLRLMIFWNIRIIFRWRLIMAIFGRRWSMMAVLGGMMFMMICRLIVAILWWRRRVIMAITWWRRFIVAIFRRRWWFIMAIFRRRRRFIMAIAWGLSILLYVVSERWSVHRDMISPRFMVRLIMMVGWRMVMKKHWRCRVLVMVM